MGDFPQVIATPAGMGGIWFSNTAPPGWAILDGSTLTGAQTKYPTLWANVDTAWKSGSDIVLPDCRGRMPVGKGTHADVSTLGNTEGIAVGNRRPKHNHTVGTDTPDHAHLQNTTLATGGASVASSGRGDAASVQNQSFNTAGASARHSHAVGPQTGAEPTDSEAYIVVNWIIKLA